MVDICPAGIYPAGICPAGICPGGICPAGVCPDTYNLYQFHILLTLILWVTVGDGG